MSDFMSDIDCNFLFEEDKLGMTVTYGSSKIIKSDSNLIGISVGGGAPFCPCIYIVQVFDNTAAAKDGTLEAGDEIISVNGENVKGKTRSEVATLIKKSNSEVIIGYNKLHADEKQGKNFDIILKRIKHRIVENMSSSTADALGLSRAILCNDSLAKKVEELEKIEFTYKGIVEHIKHMLKAFYDLNQIYKEFGDIFSEISVKEQQTSVFETFSKFGDNHRLVEKKFKEILKDLFTFCNKVIPDTKLTFKKYIDIKLDYLSYCLKAKEMDDEELAYQNMNELLMRVESGNYKYRLILRCRQEARKKFIKMRYDVLIKLDLLGQKYVQDITCQLQKLMQEFASFYNYAFTLWKDNKMFPFEVDLPRSSLENTVIDELLNFYQDEKNDQEQNLLENQLDQDLLQDFQEFNLNTIDCSEKNDQHLNKKKLI